MSKTKIKWCVNPDRTPGHSLNIVFGCPGKCPYCYGKRMAKRLGMAERMAKKEIEFLYGEYVHEFCVEKVKKEAKELIERFKNFIPTFRPSVLAQKLRKKPSMYFFSMSDPACWKQEWYDKILEKITQHMQHTFVVLTKQPWIYEKCYFPPNCWLGATIENQNQLNQFECDLSNYLEISNKLFLSIEPIQGPIKISGFMLRQLDWIIVGPETGNRKGRIIPPVEWLNYFYNLPGRVFMKEAWGKILCKRTTAHLQLRQEMPEGYLNES